MLRRLSSIAMATAVLAAATCALLIIGTGPASAACPPDPVDVTTGICLSATVPGTPSTPDPGTPGGNSPGPSNPGCPGAPGGQCTNAYGYTWLASHHCYGFKLDPQPDPTSALWGGHKPSEGSIWSCDPTVSTPGNTWFVPTGQAPAVDAATIARQLVARAPFVTAQLHTAPNGHRFPSVVNVENWLWIPASQWHNISIGLSTGGARVTLTAKPSRVYWDMGDGDSTNCYDAGRVWLTTMTDADQTDCGYTYKVVSGFNNDAGHYAPYSQYRATAPGFHITARLYYNVSWTCTGNCSGPSGTLGEFPAPTGATCLTVVERQSVVIDPNAPDPTDQSAPVNCP